MHAEPQIDWLTCAAAEKRAARDRRDLGVSRAQDRAERDTDDWTRRAAEHLRAFAEVVARGEPFLVEDAVIVAPIDLRPKEPRAWGAALKRAVSRGTLCKATNSDGSVRYGIGKTNLSPKPMWRSAR